VLKFGGHAHLTGEALTNGSSQHSDEGQMGRHPSRREEDICGAAVPFWPARPPRRGGAGGKIGLGAKGAPVSPAHLPGYRGYGEFKEYLILPKYAPSEQDKELVQDDLDISFLPEEGIELRDIVEEQMWLNIPIKPLCQDSCKGLCTICGADLNSGECGCDRHVGDPRFAVLKGFKPSLTHGRR
jgi:hypothetical protein